ncbi:hypothetical protein [Bradyrhizobium sp. BR 10261]|uniref:hypothetical protein n=1 Tax=Bradyrhizobium sp. BR 10261 TaxID=2749992 RepID=UPI001E4568C3
MALMVAISNRRLVAADDGAIAFRWKDYRITHVLPKGFHRIRHYGLREHHDRPRTPQCHPARRRPARAAG